MKVGIVGGGQLGRMLALAGIPLGLRFRVLDPVAEAATDPIAERVVGEYDDFAALAEFVRGLDVVTYEFENVPVETVRWLAERVPVYPPPAALEVAQDRIREKQFFVDVRIPVPDFRAVDSRADFDGAIAAIGLPAVLKTRRFGYDGKGQAVIRSAGDAESAWQLLGGRPLILEKLVPFDRELSILAVRGQDGQRAFYPLVENEHRNGILHSSRAPAPNVAGGLSQKAERYAAAALDALGYVGVLAIEFFEVNGDLLANEMAPRVHNSGHWTIEGAQTSQFENHLRAVVDWPLGDSSPHGESWMLNLIGCLPDVEAVLGVEFAHLHLYGKAPRPGRKLGHITVHTPDSAILNRQRARLAELPTLATQFSPIRTHS
ncbi:MAG TPA: 5-(carboxyamino)imidazole ribonucleotide synthase [Gemmataceae bacterium]|jgi:5-(carboxyamino)imidazole ribonucleotide synthase|nr:5-(carboxyamino)imidazole ribonucleotide synthase [Gemmataceae bacterium]